MKYLTCDVLTYTNHMVSHYHVTILKVKFHICKTFECFIGRYLQWHEAPSLSIMYLQTLFGTNQFHGRPNKKYTSSFLIGSCSNKIHATFNCMYHAYLPTVLEVFLIVVCLQLQHCNFCFGNANEVWQHIPRDFHAGKWPHSAEVLCFDIY